jgi:hypothetical protein
MSSIVIDLVIPFVGYASMALIVLAWYLTRKHYIKSQIAGIAANSIYAVYGVLLAMTSPLLSILPIIILGFILTGINAYNLWSSRRK